MKRIYNLIVLFTLLSYPGFNANAKTWNVTVNASSFSPASLPNVVCGDSIRWFLGAGAHTTTSTSIPSGATSWDAPIDNAHPNFVYVVQSIAGVYNYKCTPHGFTGSFTVTCSVGTHENLPGITAIYPNPFISKITIEYSEADELRIMNQTGAVLRIVLLNVKENKKEIYFDELAPGVYLFSIVKDGIIRETKKLVKTP